MTEEPDAPSSKDEVEASQELSGRQRSLYEALADKSDDLAAMYQGALQVLQAPSTVDRFAMAAHNLCEVMEKLPRYIDVPKKERSWIEFSNGLSRRNEICSKRLHVSDLLDVSHRYREGP